MPQSLDLAWVESNALVELKREASDAVPLETGGCLMGYWVAEFTEVVITEVIGPGPKAMHGKWYFFPDTSWQAKQIAKIYSDSNRLITYLGDWHSHPTTTISLSVIDRWTMMRIGQHKPARVRAPLMGVVHSPPNWALTLHCRRDKEKRHLFSRWESVYFNIKQYKKAEGAVF